MMLMTMAFLAVQCQKPAERTCFKSTGEYAELEIPLDSVRHFKLNNHIIYRIYQNNERKVVVKGGENLIQQIDVSDNGDNVLTVTNNNQCDFLRDVDEQVEVEIHYPYYASFYIDPSDSVVFEDTITGGFLDIEIRDGGGSVQLDVDVFEVAIVVSHGAADYKIGGRAERAALKVQNNGAGDATSFNPAYAYVYQNSTADVFVELGNANALVIIDGTGDVYYIGDAINIESSGSGSGKIIQL